MVCIGKNGGRVKRTNYVMNFVLNNNKHIYIYIYYIDKY